VVAFYQRELIEDAARKAVHAAMKSCGLDLDQAIWAIGIEVAAMGGASVSKRSPPIVPKALLKGISELRGLRKPCKPCSGIYFLFLHDILVYVGQAVNVYTRIGVHLSYPEKIFDSWVFLPASKDELNVLERAYIAHYAPPYNISEGGKGAKDRSEKWHMVLTSAQHHAELVQPTISRTLASGALPQEMPRGWKSSKTGWTHEAVGYIGLADGGDEWYGVPNLNSGIRSVGPYSTPLAAAEALLHEYGRSAIQIGGGESRPGGEQCRSNSGEVNRGRRPSKGSKKWP
jgi:hypothetical protein